MTTGFVSVLSSAEIRCRTTECRQIHRLNRIDPEDPDLSLKLRKSGICLSIVRNAVEILEELFDEEN